jgi:hypothetical protein
MPVYGWVLIAIGAVAVFGLVVWQVLAQQRTRRLRGRFGPEYERTVDSSESKRQAEEELASREARREQLEIRPISGAARARYLEDWQAVQAQFVDDPAGAVTRADSLIQSVMADRGYPVDDFEQRAADISVDHPDVVENYREGHRLYQQSSAGNGSTEELRQAMRHYRALFDELVQPTAADAGAATDESAANQESVVQR